MPAGARLTREYRPQRVDFLDDEVKKCRHAGCAPRIGMREQTPDSRELGNGPEHAHEVLFRVTEGRRQRRIGESIRR